MLELVLIDISKHQLILCVSVPVLLGIPRHRGLEKFSLHLELQEPLKYGIKLKVSADLCES